MEQTDIVKGAVKSPRHAFTSSCFLWNFIRLVGVSYTAIGRHIYKRLKMCKQYAKEMATLQ